jgi:2,3-bisphosphoglycerate-independent phosphoglycerate mutase
MLGELVRKVAADTGGLTVYPWGCGRSDMKDSIYGCIDGLTAISDSPTALGICASLGQRYRLIKNIDDRFPAARKDLEHSHVLLHMDEVDEYSHQKDPSKKVRVLEHIDRMMERYFSDAKRIVYFIDHGTSSITGEHLPVTVPFWTSFETSIGDREKIPLRDAVSGIMRK